MGPKTFGRSSQKGASVAGETAMRGGRERKALTIGAVCKLLKPEFADVSISKIRYLEDQRLLAPRRTQGGYRLYSPADVSRLRTILRLQRDEFLPLRVIRKELASGRADDDDSPDSPIRSKTEPVTISSPADEQLDRTDLAEQTGVDIRLIKELEEYGVIRSNGRSGNASYDDLDREIVMAVAELGRYGVTARNLRVFRGSAEREASLLEQMLGASLRSPNSEKRRDAVESLENLTAVVSRFQRLLLVRDLRRLVG